MIRIISIDNLSGAAYRLIPPAFQHSIRLETPARIHELVAGGHFDAALLPVASLLPLGSRVSPLGPFGIACRGPVQSVQLFSDGPIETLLREQRPIYVTPKSRTSVVLFRMLCRQRHGIEPKITTSYPRAAAQLLIGDAAYEYAHTHPRSEFDIDLGTWWYECTGLPFVFARWVASPSLDGKTHALINNWLRSCSDHARSPEGIETLSRMESPYGASKDRENYYKHLQTRLGLQELVGLNRFIGQMRETQHENIARIA